MAWSNAWVSSFLFMFLINGLIYGYASAAEEESSETKEFVVTLDHSNFTDFVGQHKFIVVNFCEDSKSCNKFAPEYEKAAAILSTNDPPIVLAKFDVMGEQNYAIFEGYKHRRLPSLKILRDGGNVVHDYNGPKEAADDIAAYIKKHRGPASIEIKSPEDATSVIDSYKILVVGIFPEFSGEKFENFTTLAERLRSDYEFGHTLDAKLLPHGDSSTKGPLIRLLKPFDELFADFQEFDVDALVKLLDEKSTPTVTLFSDDPKYHPFVSKLYYNSRAKAILFVNFSTEEFDAFKPKYHEVAKLYQGKDLGFLMADTNATQSLWKYYGLKEDHLPVMFIQTSDEQKYIKPNVEPDQLAPWLKDFKDGNARPYLKSAPIPEVNNEPVKVVVGESLQDMVFNSGKNVLLEFYAPWCRYCIQLAPTLDEVALSFENDPDVLIAKFDVDQNDVPKEFFDVKGFPTVYFRSSTGTILLYDGDRSKEDIIDFINKNRAPVENQESIKDEL